MLSEALVSIGKVNLVDRHLTANQNCDAVVILKRLHYILERRRRANLRLSANEAVGSISHHLN
jgi:hypothetical protein